jgi:transketolase
VLNMHTVKPLDEAALFEAVRGVRLLVVAEEHTTIGGLGSAVADAFIDNYGVAAPVIRRLGIPDRFTEEYGSQDSMLESFGLQPPQLAERVRGFLGEIGGRKETA